MAFTPRTVVACRLLDEMLDGSSARLRALCSRPCCSVMVNALDAGEEARSEWRADAWEVLDALDAAGVKTSDCRSEPPLEASPAELSEAVVRRRLTTVVARMLSEAVRCGGIPFRSALQMGDDLHTLSPGWRLCRSEPAPSPTEFEVARNASIGGEPVVRQQSYEQPSRLW